MFAKDMHRKGELSKLAKMSILAHEITLGKDMGQAFITEGYEDEYDMIQLIPNRPAYTNYEGYILYSETLNKPVFVKKEEN
jgi:hypothetical protein